MINCDRVEIVLPDMKGRVKLFQISDMHITLWNDSDTEYVRTSQKERKDLFDGLVKDGVERTEKFEAMYRLAQEEKCDSVILTGDIIDAPSEANFEYLEKTVNSFAVETVFCIGNHDWTHARDYQSDEQRKQNMPRFNIIFHKDGNGDCELSVRDYGDFALVSIDDGRGVVSKKALDTLKNFAKSKKNVIILMHIPLYADTLTEDCVKVWGKDGCIGSEATKWRIDTVTEEFVEFLHSDESTVSAIIAGDIHFDHTDRISEKTVQYCLGTSYSFRARIFDIHG